MREKQKAIEELNKLLGFRVVRHRTVGRHFCQYCGKMVRWAMPYIKHIHRHKERGDKEKYCICSTKNLRDSKWICSNIDKPGLIHLGEAKRV